MPAEKRYEYEIKLQRWQRLLQPRIVRVLMGLPRAPSESLLILVWVPTVSSNGVGYALDLGRNRFPVVARAARHHGLHRRQMVPITARSEI